MKQLFYTDSNYRPTPFAKLLFYLLSMIIIIICIVWT